MHCHWLLCGRRRRLLGFALSQESAASSTAILFAVIWTWRRRKALAFVRLHAIPPSFVGRLRSRGLEGRPCPSYYQWYGLDSLLDESVMVDCVRRCFAELHGCFMLTEWSSFDSIHRIWKCHGQWLFAPMTQPIFGKRAACCRRMPACRTHEMVSNTLVTLRPRVRPSQIPWATSGAPDQALNNPGVYYCW